MDPIATASQGSRSDDSVRQLRTLVHACAISILILTGTIFVFFYRQVVSVRKNTAELANYIGEYENSNAPEFIKDVHRKFADYAKEHPDFTPIYRRYFGTNAPPPLETATNGPTSKVVPAPAR